VRNSFDFKDAAVVVKGRLYPVLILNPAHCFTSFGLVGEGFTQSSDRPLTGEQENRQLAEYPQP
jgi:hypothetical protein